MRDEIRWAALRLEQQEQRATQLGHACLVIRAAAAAAAAAVPSAIFTPGVTAVAVVRREANELREVQLHELRLLRENAPAARQLQVLTHLLEKLPADE